MAEIGQPEAHKPKGFWSRLGQAAKDSFQEALWDSIGLGYTRGVPREVTDQMRARLLRTGGSQSGMLAETLWDLIFGNKK